MGAIRNMMGTREKKKKKSTPHLLFHKKKKSGPLMSPCEPFQYWPITQNKMKLWG
jgi:hypothetical protein